MKTALKIVAALLLLLVLLAGGGYAWATRAVRAKLSRTFEVHRVDFPIPFPLAPDAPERAGLDEDGAAALALEQAIARGRHLVEARYACTECHGANFGGGVMVDDPMLGRLLGPNITRGAGTRTGGYAPADWDRIVRHGVRPDGTPAAMPSVDFMRMSDQELSDIVAYVRSQPDVDNTVPAVTLGPLGRVLVATGALPLSADLIEDHLAQHRIVPPPAEVSVEFGEHVAGICMGCHRQNLEGGPIAGGDPTWGPAANLSPHADGLADWRYEQFQTALRQGMRPDGTELPAPMDAVVSHTRNMTEVEMEALWTYLRSIPGVPTGS